MINRISTKSDKISLTESSLLVGENRFLEIPISSIDYINFYQSIDDSAGYITIVKNELEDTDIIFFHKNHQDHFESISNELNNKLSPESLLDKKAG